METSRPTPPVKDRGFLAKGGPVRTALTPFVIAAGLGGASLGDIACAPQTAQGNDQSHEVFVPGVGKAGVSTPDAGVGVGSPQIEVAPSPVVPGAGEGQKPKKIELPTDVPAAVGNIFNGLEQVSARLTDPAAAQTYQEALRDAATYTNPNRPPAIVEVQRGGKYAQVFSDLTGQYYATRDLEILALAQQLRSFIKEKYPVTYNGRSQSEWEIQGEGK